MKKVSLVIPFMLLGLGVSTILADEVPLNHKKVVVHKISSIEDVANKIRESEEYLERLPAKLDGIKGKFQKLTSMGDKIEAKVSRYLKFMDSCSTKELTFIGADMCNSVINASLKEGTFEDILNAKREKIKNALVFIEREKQRIKAEMSESNVVKEGIAVLNDVKDILTLEI